VRLVIQRVSQASVTVENSCVAQIGAGMLVLVGIHKDDTVAVVPVAIKKLLALRIFPDEKHPINSAISEYNGEILAVSQFTLYANCWNGNRPSFDQAMAPEPAKQLYTYFFEELKRAYPRTADGVFGAHMQVCLVNDGPVTLIINFPNS